MQKKSSKSLGKSKITQEEIQQRLSIIKTAEQLDNVKRDMETSAKGASTLPSGHVPLENLSGAGQNGDAIFRSLAADYKELLDALGNYAFAPELRQYYFRHNKIVSFLAILKKAGLTLQVRSMMDIFKDRVKQRNGGNLPTIKEKVGLFGKTVSRPMKIEEIASKFEVEIDLPPGTDRPLTVCGTQNGLLNHLRTIVLEDEDVQDLSKRNARKNIARFLKAVGLLNLHTENQGEKCLIACLITPDSLQPRSAEDRDQLMKFQSIMKKGKKWLNDRMEAIKKSQIQVQEEEDIQEGQATNGKQVKAMQQS